MAKEADINEIVQTLQEAQQNKELLNALTTSVEKYLISQEEGLQELRSIVDRAKNGELKVKKRGGYRGRKPKNQEAEGGVGNV